MLPLLTKQCGRKLAVSRFSRSAQVRAERSLCHEWPSLCRLNPTSNFAAIWSGSLKDYKINALLLYILALSRFIPPAQPRPPASALSTTLLWPLQPLIRHDLGARDLRSPRAHCRGWKFGSQVLVDDGIGVRPDLMMHDQLRHNKPVNALLYPPRASEVPTSNYDP